MENKHSFNLVNIKFSKLIKKINVEIIVLIYFLTMDMEEAIFIFFFLHSYHDRVKATLLDWQNRKWNQFTLYPI